ncbi:MAG: sel1 repeat family protein, partial [Deltaproteobacteria bacterium]|nr:sel1 repeat family protein [Deltaproteobacteria bacterium]
KSKSMGTAIYYCLQGIQNNEIYSLSTLGAIYGTQENYAESFKYLEQAAKKGEFIAQYNLGVMYERGNGVAQSYAEAARLYRLAVEQGYSPAQNNLALLYYVGLGVKEDKQQARGLFQSAADQGYGLAIKNLDELF